MVGFLSSEDPASRTRTVTPGSSDRRLAKTQPADPAPTGQIHKTRAYNKVCAYSIVKLDLGLFKTPLQVFNWKIQVANNLGFVLGIKKE